MGRVTLTTDFGGHYVGIMKAVILGIDADAEIYEITTELDSYDVKGGAFALRSSYSYFPKGTVHIGVVDPGVGSSRRAIAIRTKNHYFVGPDNGLLAMAARDDGIVAVRELTNPKLHRAPVSPTFHGRDIFAPVAAHLSRGGEWEEVGRPIDGIVDLELLRAVGGDGSVSCEVIFVDRFGNLTLSIERGFVGLEGEVGVVHRGKELVGKVVRTYAEGGTGICLLVGSGGFYEIAVGQGSAAAVLGAKSGDSIKLTPRGRGACDKG